MLITISTVQYSDFLLLQIPYPDINLLMILLISGLIELICLGCVLGIQYTSRRRKYTKSAKETGFALQVPKSGEGCGYILLIIILFVAPIFLIPPLSEITNIDEIAAIFVWWWLAMWVAGIPIILIIANRKQLKDLEKAFIEQSDTRRPAEPVHNGEW